MQLADDPGELAVKLRQLRLLVSALRGRLPTLALAAKQVGEEQARLQAALQALVGNSVSRDVGQRVAKSVSLAIVSPEGDLLCPRTGKVLSGKS